MLDAAKRVDRLGYDHLWTWDHLYAIFGDPYQPIFEGWTALAAWAMRDRARPGSGCSSERTRSATRASSRRPPRRSTTSAAAGRSSASAGPGSSLEHQAHGIDFGTGFGQRLDWLDESVGAMRDGSSTASRSRRRRAAATTSTTCATLRCRSRRRLPIMIGGSGEKKTLRTVARYADMWNAMGPVDADGAQDRRPPRALRGGRSGHRRDRVHARASSSTIRDSKAEAERVWRAAMAHNRTPLTRSRGRRHVLERIAGGARRSAAPLCRDGLPDGDLRAARPVRRGDASSGSSARSSRSSTPADPARRVRERRPGRGTARRRPPARHGPR